MGNDSFDYLENIRKILESNAEIYRPIIEMQTSIRDASLNMLEYNGRIKEIFQNGLVTKYKSITDAIYQSTKYSKGITEIINNQKIELSPIYEVIKKNSESMKFLHQGIIKNFGIKNELFENINKSIQFNNKFLNISNELAKSINAFKFDYSKMTNLQKLFDDVKYESKIDAIAQQMAEVLNNSINDYSLDDFINQVSSSIENDNKVNSDYSFDSDNFFSEYEEIQNLNDEIGLNEKVRIKWENFKTENFIPIIIILFLLGIFRDVVIVPELQNIFNNAITKNTSCVKSSPSSNSKVLENIPKDTDIIILDDEKYYYKILYTNENNKTVEGYIAKRNLQIYDDIDKL